MSISSEGMDQVRVMLKLMKDASLMVEEEFITIVGETKEDAKNMAPIEYGDLKDAIMTRTRNSKGQFASTGISSYEIYINNTHPVCAEREKRNKIETVGEYAWLVHEYMGWAGVPGAMMHNGKPFMPSDKSVAAGNERHVDAGGKFLERAGLTAWHKMNNRLGLVLIKHLNG